MPPRKTGRRRSYKHAPSFKTRRGGAVIGKGSYGCVYRPALRCPGNSAVNRSKQVSKLVKNESIAEEIKGVDILKKIKDSHKYFIYPLDDSCPFNISAQPDQGNVIRSFQTTCKIKDIHQNSYVLFNEDGGVNPGSNAFNSDTYYPFFEGLLNIFHGLDLLHQNGAVHHDIKPDNMVVRVNEAGTGLDFHLIDFGLLQKLDELKEKFSRNEIISKRYDRRYIIWPYYSFILSYNKQSLLFPILVKDQDTRTKFTMEFLYPRFQEWEAAIRTYVGTVPESVYYMDKSHRDSTLGNPKIIKESILRIVENEDSFINFAKNIDTYSLGFALSIFFTNFFGAKYLFDATGAQVVHFYIMRHSKNEPYNIHDWKNAELEAWVHNFVNTVAVPFYNIISIMCNYNKFEKPRPLQDLITSYQKDFLVPLRDALYEPGTYTERKGFIKFLHYIKPAGFSLPTAPAYKYTPIPPTPPTLPLKPLPTLFPIVQAAGPALPIHGSMNLGVQLPPKVKREIQITGRGAPPPRAQLKRQGTPIPSKNSKNMINSKNSTAAPIGRPSKKVAFSTPMPAAVVAPAPSTIESSIVSAPREITPANQGFF